MEEIEIEADGPGSIERVADALKAQVPLGERDDVVSVTASVVVDRQLSDGVTIRRRRVGTEADGGDAACCEPPVESMAKRVDSTEALAAQRAEKSASTPEPDETEDTGSSEEAESDDAGPTGGDESGRGVPPSRDGRLPSGLGSEMVTFVRGQVTDAERSVGLFQAPKGVTPEDDDRVVRPGQGPGPRAKVLAVLDDTHAARLPWLGVGGFPSLDAETMQEYVELVYGDDVGVTASVVLSGLHRLGLVDRRTNSETITLTDGSGSTTRWWYEYRINERGAVVANATEGNDD